MQKRIADDMAEARLIREEYAAMRREDPFANVKVYYRAHPEHHGFSYTSVLLIIRGRKYPEAGGPVVPRNPPRRKKKHPGWCLKLTQELADHVRLTYGNRRSSEVREILRNEYGIEMSRNAVGALLRGETWRPRPMGFKELVEIAEMRRNR